MAVWTDVSSTVLEPGDPIRSVDIIAIKENITALSEGADGAPKISRLALAPNTFGNQLFTSSGTFTVPEVVTSLKVTVVGGGGGGGAGKIVGYSLGTGGTGGGGGIAVGIFTVTPGATYTVTIGSGGVGTNTFNTNGSAGGTSSFGSVLSATGGSGGARSVQVGSDPGTATSPGQSAGGVGSGTQRNSLLCLASASVFSRARATSSTARIAYALGASANNSAGAGGQGEVGESGNNAVGGVDGAVFVEW